VSLAGIGFARRIFAAPALARHSVNEITPGPEVSSEDALADYIRNQGTTIYHIVGTCRMGEDPLAVVDSRLKVRGLDRLRVVDASVMPTVTTANTNAPTIMIAEKAAAMIREDVARMSAHGEIRALRMQTADRLATLMDHLGLARAHVATQVASDVAQFAAQYPERIGGLVLCAPTRLDPAPFENVAARLLLMSGDKGLTAQT